MKFIKLKHAFSLIELIVGITISMLLMVSVGVFISGGMQNIFAGQKALENIDDFTNFAYNLNKSIDLIQSGSFVPINTSSGIIFKRGQNFGDGGFSYIGSQILDGVYCGSGSINTQTNHIFIKSFIPFEEQSEDIFSNYDDILTSNIQAVGTKIYKSFQKENRVAIRNGTNWDTIVGKEIYGDGFTQGGNGTDIYLNYPTGLATDGTNLYISDTLNNRVLYLDNTDKIHLLLDESDGLEEPTGLYYDDSEKALYISNSQKGEIIKYSSKSLANNPELKISGINTNVINRLEMSFYNRDGTDNNITGPTNKTDITFSNVAKNDDYLGITNNKFDYYFVNYNGSIYNEPSCIGTEERLIGGNPVKCLSTGTGQTSTNLIRNFNDTTIDLNNITPILSNTGSYYINIKLFNGATEKYSEFYAYFTQSDDDLTTKNDNTLTTVYSGINYPTGIWGTGATDHNIFGDSTYSDLAYHDSDYLLDIPIKSIDITNNSNDLLTIILKYFKTYNCYNTDEKVEKTFITKKNLK
ncbi:MAG: hypothetical protein PHS49_06200 [Candidatus Gracilibacteria bacterium]|nr:hypothetical protein [Candidatus Gracilibacteria bacterium]